MTNLDSGTVHIAGFVPVSTDIIKIRFPTGHTKALSLPHLLFCSCVWYLWIRIRSYFPQATMIHPTLHTKRHYGSSTILKWMQATVPCDNWKISKVSWQSLFKEYWEWWMQVSKNCDLLFMGRYGKTFVGECWLTMSSISCNIVEHSDVNVINGDQSQFGKQRSHYHGNAQMAKCVLKYLTFSLSNTEVDNAQDDLFVLSPRQSFAYCSQAGMHCLDHPRQWLYTRQLACQASCVQDTLKIWVMTFP